MKKQLQFLFLFIFLLPLASAAQVTFTAQSATVNCEANTLSIDVVVDNFTDMNSFQFTINWDQAVLDHTSFTNNNFGISLGTSQLSNGFSQVSWFSTGSGGSTTLPNNTVLFTINFDLIGNASSSPISFTGNPSPIEVIQGGMPILPSQFSFQNGAITFTDVINPSANCPTDITVDTGGAATAQVPSISPSGTDNCAIELYNYSLSGATTGSGTGDVSNNIDFNIGTTTVTYTAVDFLGNTDNCSFDVTVENAGGTGLEVFGQQVNVNCLNNMVSIDIIANNFTNLKGAQFSLNWNAGALSYIDTSNIAFPTGVSFGINNASNGVITFSWFNSTPTSFPNGQVLFTINYSVSPIQAGLSIPIPFVNAPTFIQFVDENNTAIPSSEYTLTNGLVTIIDTGNPTITCPSDITVDAGNAGSAIVNNLAPVTTDDCGVADTTYTLTGATSASGNGDASGTSFNVGTTTVEYTVIDFGGNTDICSFNVTITSDPIDLITISIDSLDLDCNNSTAELCLRVEDFTDIRGAQFTINWDATELSYIDTSNINLPNGIFGINDVSSGILTFSWFSAGSPTSLADGSSIFCINFDLVNPVGGDSYDISFSNVPTPVQVATQSSLPNFLPVSDYVISNGNIMFLADTQDPTLACPTDVTVDAGNATSIAVNNLAPTVSDNCGTPTVTYALTGATTGSGNNDASSMLFNVGVTTVTYIATDDSGNSEVCNFTVTVNNNPQAPITLSIDSLDLDCNDNTAQICVKVENFEDIRGAQFTVNWNSSELQYIDTTDVNLPNSNFGITNIASGTLTFSWFSTGSPITLIDGTSLFCINFDLVNPSGGDSYNINFSNFPTPVQLATQSSLPNFLPSSDYVISDGNIMIIPDTQAPNLTCPMDLTVNSGSASSIAVNGLAPTVSDNCGTPTVTYELTGATTGTGSNDASSLIYNQGVTTITYTATDNSGNIEICSFTVTVESAAPSIIEVNIDSLIINCSDNSAELCIRVKDFIDVRGTQFTLNWNPAELTYIDTSQIVVNNPSFGINNISSGTMTFSWFASSTPVTLSDGTALFCINFDITNPTPGSDYDVVFDLSGSTPFQLVTQSSLPNGVPASDYVTYDGNIMIEADTQAPTLDCPDDTTINSNGAPNVVVNNIGPTSSDDCGTPTITYSLSGATTGSGNDDASGSSFNTGMTVVTYTATDAAGNSVDCSFNITVVQENLSITCPTNVFQGVDPGLCTATLSNLVLTINSTPTNIASINYSITGNPSNPPILGSGGVINHTFEIGTSIVEFKVIDIFGSEDSCSFNVTIIDNEAPVLTNCPLDITVTPASGCNAAVNWSPPTATDNCDTDVTVTGSHASGEIFQGGTTVVTYTATDDFNNTSTCSFTVTVRDTIAPVMFCPADITVNTNGDVTDPNGFITSANIIDCDSIQLSFLNPAISDNCGVASVLLNSGLASGSNFGIGVNTLEFIGTDTSGNSAICSVDITVISASSITVTASKTTLCEGETLTLGIVPTPAAGATISWTGPNGFTSNLPNPEISPVAQINTGTYIAEVTEGICTSIDSVTIVVNESPDLTITSDPEMLECISAGQDLTLTGTSTSNITTWEWLDPNGNPIGTNDPTLLIENANTNNVGDYTLTATNADGCSTTIIQTVTISEAIDAPVITSTCAQLICTGESCTLFGQFAGSVDSVLWTANSPNVGLPTVVNTNSIVISPSQTGSYTVTFTIFKDGCSNSVDELIIVTTAPSVEPDEVTINFVPQSVPNTFNVITNDITPPGWFINQMTSTVNGEIVNNQDGTFTYTPNNGFVGTDQFMYELCVLCDFGTDCRQANVSIEVVVDGCLIPTVITPNGDGMNDEWIISCDVNTLQDELIVYNRWGDEVFQASPYQDDWKGTYNGEDLPDGTYYYIYKRNAADNDPQKGYLTILR